jgi:AraC-like DNA-binding protein
MKSLSQPNTSVLRYEGAVAGPRYESWREEFCRGFAKTDFDPSGSERVEFEARIASFSNLSTIAFKTGRFISSRNIVSAGCDDFILATAGSRPMNGNYAGRGVELLPNQMSLIDVNTPSSVAIQGSGRLVSIRIPRDQLLSICPNAENQLGRTLSDDPSLREMISRYTAIAIDLAPGLDAIGQHTVAQHLIDLIGLLLGTGRDQTELAKVRGYAAARLELIRADLLNNLGRSNLSIGEIAGRYGLSARQAQRLFERSGVTFTEFVLENRLLLARRLLLDHRYSHRKISDIAHSAGFADVSYFNRVFRKRFGTTPSATRGV